jgi:hypothetical protein
MKQVTKIPPPEYGTLRDPWLDELLDGKLRQLDEVDWKPRYKTSRSAASAIHAAAVKRGIKATVAVRGETLYVQGSPNGTTPTIKRPVRTTPAAKKAPAKKATATA